MTASIIDGRTLAEKRRNTLKNRIADHVNRGFRAPGLAVILIGHDPASTVYVENKRKACAEVGIKSHAYDLDAQISQEALLKLIDELNQSTEIDGILVQLPLPSHIQEAQVIERIAPMKDVDGFHPYNLGRLAQKRPLLRPCTPMGIMHLLEEYQLCVRGKHAVVIGASNIVGRPMGLELLMAGATVTVCHRLTQNLEQLVRIADLLVVATGHQNIIESSWLHQNQIIIDVGIHRLDNGKLRGDVDFDKAKNHVAWITPVPGGVGPMTVMSLLENTFTCATYQANPNQTPH